jgi:hypothetical protein
MHCPCCNTLQQQENSNSDGASESVSMNIKNNAGNLKNAGGVTTKSRFEYISEVLYDIYLSAYLNTI